MNHNRKPAQGLLSWVLAMILLFSLLPAVPAAADGLEQTDGNEPASLSEAEESTEPTEPIRLTLEELMEKFPEGKYWNGGDPDGWTEKPCTHHGNCSAYGWNGWCGCNSFNGQSIQCMGFAEKLGYDATGYSPRENANGWKTVYYSSSINTLKAGDIVRRNGHSMYVTAVDGDTVTVADCNAINRSCNIRWGVTKTKSDLKYNNFEYVRVAPEELRIGYRGKCESYCSSGTAVLQRDTVLMTYPCTAEVYENALEIAVLPADTSLNICGLYQNTVGQYWYETIWEDQTCYFPAENTTDYCIDLSGVTVSNVSAPKNTRKGSGFPIKGTINSEILPMLRIDASIFSGNTVSDAPLLTSTDGDFHRYTYSIYGSAVDDNLTFGKLPLGEHTYLLTATVQNHYISENELIADLVTVRLHQNTFTVSSSLPCSHSYTEEMTTAPGCGTDGVITYTCSKCDFTYTKTVFALGGEDAEHQYTDWVITTQATMTAAGEQQKACKQCGHTVLQEIPVLAGEVAQWGIVLDGELRVNFQMHLQEDANVVVTVADDSYNYDLDTVAYYAENNTYQLSVPVAAAQMADTIRIQILNGEEVSVEESYTVLQYAQEILSDENQSDCHSLVRQMLHYGGAAQVYFDYNVSNPVDAGIPDIPTSSVPETLEQPVTVSGSAEGIRFYGASLVYRDKIAVRYYFTGSEQMEAYTFRCGDAEYTPVCKDGLWYVELPGILIQDLDESLTLTVNDCLSITYCPMHYIVRMNQKGSQNTKALMQAIYSYHLAAKAFSSR